MDNIINVLLVEDDHIFYSLVKLMLGKSETLAFNVFYSKNLKDAFNKLSNEKIDVILLDLNLPDSFDDSTVKNVHESFPDHPIIVLTNNHEEETALKVLRQGAKEIFFKAQVNPDMLTRVIRYAIERKNLEKELRATEEFTKTLLKFSPTPTIVINRDRTIRYINPAVEKLSGFKSEEILGIKPPYPWNTKDHFELFKEELEGAHYNRTNKYEENFKKKNGKNFSVEVTSEPVIINGVCEYFLCNWIDITERKKTELNIAKQNEILKERVKELNFMYELLKKISKHNISKHEIFKTIIQKIPTAFQYSEIACSKLIIENEEFICSSKYFETEWKLSSKIYTNNHIEAGVIEVYYMEEMPIQEEGPFLNEERKLLDAIAQYLGGLIS